MASNDPARRRARGRPGDAAAPGSPLAPEKALQAAYAGGLRLLARREISEARLRERLAARDLPAEAVDGAIAKLKAAGALDDRRAVRACARTIVLVKQRGRLRARQELQKLGFAPDLAAAAIDEWLAPAAEATLLDKVIARQLRGRNADLSDPAVFRRVYGALVRRGFSPSTVQTALRNRARGVAPDPPDAFPDADDDA